MPSIKKLTNDFNGSGQSIKVPHTPELTGGYEVNISKYSGLVSVIKRRSSKEIANEWSQKIFGKKFTKSTYTAKVPAVIARQTYVLETLLSQLTIRKKSLCDLGAGEGDFLNMLKKKKIINSLFAVDPSSTNCKLLTKNEIKNFCGTIEEFVAKKNIKQFDILTMMWTLCNTSNCIDVIKAANLMCKKNGYILIAESSRILVPYKKPIQMYFSKGNPDIHSFHFSKNSLCNLLILNKFKPVYINRYIDSDVLIVIAKKTNIVEKKELKIDDYKKVKSFFSNWYTDSKKYKDELI
ncbi:methyltransferase domain-containing protein [Candidatus Pelagibacter sp.]|nr:methyltransferase domain-containing protein [Candidatus Pelagibacter sp.]